MTALSILFGVLMFATALILILLVLVQRGRGGGLSGALGGMGGQSAFGTKAGDLFTRITIFLATFWILLCLAAILVLNRQTTAEKRGSGEGTEYTTVESSGGTPEPDKTGAAGTVPAGTVPAGTAPAGTVPAEKGAAPGDATPGDAGAENGAAK